MKMENSNGPIIGSQDENISESGEKLSLIASYNEPNPSSSASQKVNFYHKKMSDDPVLVTWHRSEEEQLQFSVCQKSDLVDSAKRRMKNALLIGNSYTNTMSLEAEAERLTDEVSEGIETKSRKQRKLKIEDSAAADEVLLQDIVKMETVNDQDNELVLNNILENIDQKPSIKKSRNQRKLKIEDSAAVNEVLLRDIVKMESVDDQDNEPLSNKLGNIDQKPSRSFSTGLDDPMVPIEDPVDAQESQCSKCEKYKEKYRRMKQKYKDLKKANQNQDLGVTQVELVEGSNVTIDKEILDKICRSSSNPSTLARSLFRAMFTEEELATRSLFGKHSNAFPNLKALKEICPVRRNAIFDYVAEISEISPTGDMAGMVRKAIKKKLSKTVGDFLRESRKKYHQSKI